MQAEVSPPHYDDLLLNWIPPLSMSVIGRRRILKPWFTYLEYSGKLLASPWSFGIIVFSWNAQTTLWMLLGAKLDWHVDWVTQHRMHTQNGVCANCTHVYTSCNMCSMDLIKKSVCFKSLHIHSQHSEDTKLRICSVTSLTSYAKSSKSWFINPCLCTEHVTPLSLSVT